ncbi:30S ribosomal protein S6 [bacterium]|nr:30S ribosomal protein S6 [candidate division CSSED10-310 bacterium]
MYEVIAILNPNTTTEVMEGKITDWTQIVQGFGAELHRVERWGKRNLAYEVKKFNQGIYVLFHIDGKHDVIDELERRFRIADEVIRYQSVKLSDVEYKASVDLLDGLKSRFVDGESSGEKRKQFSDDDTDTNQEESDYRYDESSDEFDDDSSHHEEDKS